MGRALKRRAVGSRLAGAALAAFALLLALPVPAPAQGAPGSVPQGRRGASATAALPSGAAKPTTARLSKAAAIRIARSDPKVAEQRRRYGPLDPSAQAKPGTWQVDFYARGIDRVQVLVDDASGQIRESWTGYQVAWQMARGYPGQFGHKLNAPYVWLPLAAIFVLGLFDFRRPWPGRRRWPRHAQREGRPSGRSTATRARTGRRRGS